MLDEQYKNDENLKEDQLMKKKSLIKRHVKTGRACMMREALQDIYK